MPEIKFLTDKEYKIVRALSDALIPRGGAFPLGAEDLNAAEKVDEFLGYLRPDIRMEIKVMMKILNYSPLFSLKLRTFTRMSLDERIAYIQAWEESRFYSRRAILLALKALVCMAFYADPKVEEILGYSVGCVK